MASLHLFNGMSVGRMAQEHIGDPCTEHYVAEIDKFANEATQIMFPDSMHLGDVTMWRLWGIDWSKIDDVTGGFPCQAWSMAGKQLGDKDPRGMLFWTMLDIMAHVKKCNPNANFLIENVKMKKEFEQYITHHTEQALGTVHKTLINSALVSAQNRNRYYWTNYPVTQPDDLGIVLADVLEVNPDDITVMSQRFTKRNANILRDDVSGKAKNLSAMEYVKNGRQGDYINVKCGRVVGRKINPETGKRDDYNPALRAEQRVETRPDDKSGCLTTVQKDNVVVDVGTHVGTFQEWFARTKDYGGSREEYDRLAAVFSEGWHKWWGEDGAFRLKKKFTKVCNDDPRGKAITMTARQYANWNGNIVRRSPGAYRKLTPRECMRLQTIPEHYIDRLLDSGISNTQLYKMAGNGWTMKVIAHILSQRP